MTLWLGLAVILLSELMLVLDITLTGRWVVPETTLPEPRTLLGEVARWWSVYMTTIVWCGYLLVLEGLLTRLAWRQGEGGGAKDSGTEDSGTGVSPVTAASMTWRRGGAVRERPRMFLIAYVSSIGVWKFFDWINFTYMHAWNYHNLPDSILALWLGYAFAFAAITPGMLLTAQLYQRLGLRDVRGPGVPIPPWAWGVIPLIGVGLISVPFLLQSPLANFALWVSVIFLLDPINYLASRPSIIADWAAGRWSRTINLMLGGLTCGLLWEFWNYWAVAKWTYDLPFLGPLESVRLFEMPLPGYAGFLPFAIECWVALQTILIPFSKFTEKLPTEEDIL